MPLLWLRQGEDVILKHNSQSLALLLLLLLLVSQTLIVDLTGSGAVAVLAPVARPLPKTVTGP